MKFVANLRQETIDAFAAEDIQPAAYLLSSHRATPATLAMAATIRQRGLPLFADNGTKAIIEQTVAAFATRAAPIREQVTTLRNRLGRTPRRRDVPVALRHQAVALATELIGDATKASQDSDPDALLEAQLSMAPTHLIAKEDFATACMIALDLERELTGWPVARWTARNRRSIKLWKRTADDPRCRDIKVYAVLSAVDYDTARAAGRLAAEQGVRHAALGIAGINLDPSATDYFTIGRAEIPIERPAPRRFVRLAQILKGLADGYDDAGEKLASFHCLGLGAPAMLALAAAALPEGTVVTADATSPVHDAVRDHVMYDSTRQGERASLVEIVSRIVEGDVWRLSSPFAKAFGEKFGHFPAKARASWIEARHPAITLALLARDNGITDAVPLFARADPDLTRTASKTHIAHNHWVLGALCDTLKDGPGRHALARAAMRRTIELESSGSATRGLTAALQVLDTPTDR